MMNLRTTAILISTLLLFVSQLVAQNTDWEKVDLLLDAVESFEYGSDAAPLTELEQIALRISGDDRATMEDRLLGSLDNSSRAGKQFICSLLRSVGSEKCVQALAGLLKDPETVDAAIYALGRMESDAAATAIIAVVNEKTGPAKATLLNALADRKESGALDLFRQNLSSEENAVAQASIRGLGIVGNVDDANSLIAMLESAEDPVKSWIANALLNCAQRFASGDEFEMEAADGIYESAMQSDNLHMRIAGLRGIAAHSEEVIQVALDDPTLRPAAISLIPGLKSEQSTQWAIDQLSKLSDEEKVLMFRALALRGDKTAANSIAAFLDAASESIRVAAIESMKELGSSDHVERLIELSIQGSDPEKAAARNSLISMNGNLVDQAIASQLNADSIEKTIACIGIVTARNAADATTQMVGLAKHENQQVRQASIVALGQILPGEDLDQIVKLLVRPREAADRVDIEAAAAKVIKRADDPEESTAVLARRWETAGSPAKPALLRLFGEAGYTDALQFIRYEFGAGSPTLQTAAVTAMTRWPNDETMEDLVQIAQKARKAEHREIALNGVIAKALAMNDSESFFIDLISELDDDKSLKTTLEAFGQSNAKSAKSIDLAQGFLDNDQLQATAGLAMLRIANRLRNENQQRARSALETVIASVENNDVKARAREVLFDMDKFEDHITQWVTIGPFTEQGKQGPAIYETVFEPETNSQLTGWEPLDQGINEWAVNLEQQFGGGDFCAAYVRTMVWSESAQDVQLEMGSDDGVKAWLNGKEVFSQWTSGGVSPRQKRVPVSLNEGWNVLMLKVVDHQGGWGFCCRIRQLDGSKLEGIRYKAE